MPPALTDETLEACDLSRWDGCLLNCRWCGEPLPAGRPRWCSKTCAEVCYDNHFWTQARYAACLRDGWTCQMCWAGPALDALLRWLLPSVTPVEWRQMAAQNPDLAAAWWMHNSICPEVDHIEPLFGHSRMASCANHQANLRVLCHDCHVAETARWRGIRRALRQAFDVDLAAPEAEPVTVAA